MVTLNEIDFAISKLKYSFVSYLDGRELGPSNKYDIQEKAETELRGLIRRALGEAMAKPVGTRYRHKKRDTEYTKIADGFLQIGYPAHLDMTPIVIYRGYDNQYWARPKYEFEDGRFERVHDGPSP